MSNISNTPEYDDEKYVTIPNNIPLDISQDGQDIGYGSIVSSDFNQNKIYKIFFRHTPKIASTQVIEICPYLFGIGLFHQFLMIFSTTRPTRIVRCVVTVTSHQNNTLPSALRLRIELSSEILPRRNDASTSTISQNWLEHRFLLIQRRLSPSSGVC